MRCFDSKYSLVFLLLIAIVSGCSKTPNGVLRKSDMADLLVDVYKGEAFIEASSGSYASDSMRKLVKQSVLLAHGVTQQQFDSSLMWYGKHIEDYVEVYKDVESKLSKEEDYVMAEARREGMATMAAGDSVDLWDDGAIRFISHGMSDSTMSFEFVPNSDFMKGDAYQWQFRMLSDDAPLDIFIGADYDDGSMAYLETDFKTKGWNRIRFQTDSTRNLSRIYGIAKLKDGTSENVALLDSVQLVRTRVNSLNYYSNLNRLKKLPNNSDLIRQRGGRFR